MNLYYAFGGGLGHLTRASALIYTLGLSPGDFMIVTNSEFAVKVFPHSKVVKVQGDLYHKPDELKKLIRSLILRYQIQHFFVDTFPIGIAGELSDMGNCNCRFYYVARFLKWDVYSGEVKNMSAIFEKTYIVENLGERQMEFIQKYSKKQEAVHLNYPENKKTDELNGILKKFDSPPWLIAHSGPFTELENLYRYALDMANIKCMDPDFLVISQTDKKLTGTKSVQVDYYPARDFYAHCPVIFTACGFNSMLQLSFCAAKHYFIPFERKYDDQFWRAIQRKSIYWDKSI
jgi:hypothetical protein